MGGGVDGGAMVGVSVAWDAASAPFARDQAGGARGLPGDRLVLGFADDEGDRTRVERGARRGAGGEGGEHDDEPRHEVIGESLAGVEEAHGSGAGGLTTDGEEFEDGGGEELRPGQPGDDGEGFEEGGVGDVAGGERGLQLGRGGQVGGQRVADQQGEQQRDPDRDRPEAQDGHGRLDDRGATGSAAG